MSKMIVSFFLTFLLFQMSATDAAAASEISIVTSMISGDEISVYINSDIPESSITGAFLGTDPCEVISYNRGSELPSDTLILADTSGSIPKEIQEKTGEFIAELIDGKNENERYAIASFGTQINYLCDYTADRYELSKAAGKLDYSEKFTYIYSLLGEALESTGKDVFSKIVIISDGVENSSDGITYDEIMRIVSRSHCPVYTIGIENNNQEPLKRFYSFARSSGGKSCTIFSDTDVSEICGMVNETRDHTCIGVKIPEGLADGSLKYLSISGEGFECGEDIRMPVIAADMQTGEETFTEAVSITGEVSAEGSVMAEAHDNGSFIGIYIAMVIVGAMAVIAAVVMIIISGKGKKEHDRPVPPTEVESVPSSTEIAQIKLVDVNAPERIYRHGLSKSVTVGRDKNKSMIVIPGDKGISGRHFIIEIADGNFILKNVSTTNSVYINERQLPEISKSPPPSDATLMVIDPGMMHYNGISMAMVKSGDIIRISRTVLRLEIECYGE